MRARACDYSKWQKNVNVPILLEEGYEIFFIRLGYGISKDRRFEANIENAEKYSVPWSPYHFFLPQLSWESQANFVLSTLANLGVTPKIPISGDLEVTGGLFPKSRVLPLFSLYMAEMQKEFSKPAIIYTSIGFWLSVGGVKASWATKYDLWLAQWPYDNLSNAYQLMPRITQDVLAEELHPNQLAPWKIPLWWQYSSKGLSEGVGSYSKRLDQDASIPTKEDILAYYDILPIEPPPDPVTLEELIDRFISLEQWAVSKGYQIEKENIK